MGEAEKLGDVTGVDEVINEHSPGHTRSLHL